MIEPYIDIRGDVRAWIVGISEPNRKAAAKALAKGLSPSTGRLWLKIIEGESGWTVAIADDILIAYDRTKIVNPGQKPVIDRRQDVAAALERAGLKVSAAAVVAPG